MTDSEFGGEEGLNGVTVRLKSRYGGTIDTTYTNEYGIYDEIYGGEYRFYNVSLDQIQSGNYYVEFEYSGVTYHAVETSLDSDDGSKAAETYSRQNLDNNCFSSVTGNGTNDLYLNGVGLHYNSTNQYKSNMNWISGDSVQATTEQAGYYLYTSFTPTAPEIRYVNLGLFKKEQTDYALIQDLYNVRVGVNGQQHVYRYGTLRYQGFGEYTDESIYQDSNIGVKFQNNRGTYTRTIYKADYDYESKTDSTKNLNVYVTYKIALKNQSTYTGRINNIVDYCDSNYTIEKAGYSINEQDVITDEVSTYEDRTSYSGYKKYIINTSSRNIESEEEQYLYIQFKMNKEAIGAVMNNGQTKYNIVEINSYTTFDDDTGGSISVYDVDSVPGNANPENISTFEDDTDSAMSLKLVFGNTRTVEGIVFEDNTKMSDNVQTGKERKGDGKYLQTEDKLIDGTENKENIVVTMTEVDKDGNVIKDGLKYTAQVNSKGEFKISDYIAGYYQLTYTWGSKTYKVQYYKGTVYNKARNGKTQVDPLWYRGSEYENDTTSKNERYTDAMDNATIRQNIEAEMRKVTKNTLEKEVADAYEKGYNPVGKEITITRMNSTTPTMQLSVEYELEISRGDDSDRKPFEIKNIDFGIVERPKQQLELSKQISGYKIKLANGQVLVDAKIDKNGNISGTYPYTTIVTNPGSTNNLTSRGLLKTEMDNELIQGATLETTYTITVKNVSELDYTTQDYYYFGDKGNGANIVRTSVTQLLDYVDGRVEVIEQDGGKVWIDVKEISNNYSEEYNIFKKDDKTYLGDVKQYVTRNLSKFLAPGESNSINLYTSKLLTSTDDNLFNNQSEITEVTKPNGFTSGTPVKMLWDSEKSRFNVANSETITIIPSTGENRDYTTPIVIAIVTISILGVGTVLIKKFVVK